MIIVDAHEDLAYNMRTFGRNYTLAAAETRRRELGTPIPERNGDTLLGYPDYRRGQVAVVFSTLFASPKKALLSDWDVESYSTPQQAYELYSLQVDTYHRLVDEHPDSFRLIQAAPDLDKVLAGWESTGENSAPAGKAPHPPVGLVMLMEGAEGVRSVGELEEWWQRGVRLIGLAWKGNRYTGGTREPGPLTKEGFALLEGMADLGFGLDLSHMDEEAALQSLDAYPGVILASHSNAKALIKNADGNRHLPDAVVRGLIERDGVIGVLPLNKFLDNTWTPADGRDKITLQHLVAQIDYICQLAGDAHHVGIGTDFDGGQGVQEVPGEIDTISDVQKLVPLLAEKGYSETDIAAVLSDNWLALLRRVLPEAL